MSQLTIPYHNFEPVRDTVAIEEVTLHGDSPRTCLHQRILPGLAVNGGFKYSGVLSIRSAFLGAL